MIKLLVGDLQNSNLEKDKLWEGKRHKCVK